VGERACARAGEALAVVALAAVSGETWGHLMLPVTIALMVVGAAKRQSQLPNRGSYAELGREAERERDEPQS
jgi:hypothetical protein